MLAPAQGPLRGSVVLSPGRTEPIEKYFETVEELQARGFVVLVHDWRGQGLSQRWLPDRLRGHARGWRPYLADYARLLAAFEVRLPGPWIMLGHSMGGGLNALTLARGERRFAAAVLSAPMLAVRMGDIPPWLAGAVCRVMRLCGQGGAPVARTSDPLHDVFEENIVTHDRARWERFEAQLAAMPDLRLGGFTWSWVQFALTLQGMLARPRVARRIATPLTLVLAEEEQLVSNAAARILAARAPDARLVEVEGAYHELLMETDPVRAQFWAAFDARAEEVAPIPLAVAA